MKIYNFFYLLDFDLTCLIGFSSHYYTNMKIYLLMVQCQKMFSISRWFQLPKSRMYLENHMLHLTIVLFCTCMMTSLKKESTMPLMISLTCAWLNRFDYFNGWDWGGDWLHGLNEDLFQNYLCKTQYSATWITRSLKTKTIGLRDPCPCSGQILYFLYWNDLNSKTTWLQIPHVLVPIVVFVSMFHCIMNWYNLRIFIIQTLHLFFNLCVAGETLELSNSAPCRSKLPGTGGQMMPRLPQSTSPLPTPATANLTFTETYSSFTILITMLFR